ncbi:hypothetical protein [Acetobacter orleanensis]|uniref:Phasin domain-containing protein n=1 Tax=Acetobacter orleanensis TaxID=104099 RepID=A0A4Y3TM57_9PROT|nr:hypothetical protein [Acetobacter orleanensis]KXV62571.1 hypothetical protein AD949_10715 [Acetobacter orleanensis]PCD79983.1 hypothetical protein CO710_03755 [Acetobacter orleanensis]GAN68294.1 hypothetical protein Abol_015_133 [Acetobacter orleanensis JCM 7639]GEB82813.1 hypothetical protein AOR01nite_12900 [Acetobacter orleanensis]
MRSLTTTELSAVNGGTMNDAQTAAANGLVDFVSHMRATLTQDGQALSNQFKALFSGNVTPNTVIETAKADMAAGQKQADAFSKALPDIGKNLRILFG